MYLNIKISMPKPMKEKHLIKIAIICSLIGILIILLITEFTVIPLVKISEINKDLLNKEVKVQGKIISIKETPGLYIFTVEDDSIIKAVMFKEELLQISKGDSVEIQGRVIEYKKELEIQINKLNEI